MGYIDDGGTRDIVSQSLMVSLHGGASVSEADDVGRCGACLLTA